LKLHLVTHHGSRVTYDGFGDPTVTHELETFFKKKLNEKRYFCHFQGIH